MLGIKTHSNLQQKDQNLTCSDGTRRQCCCQLLRNGANTIGGKGVLPRRQHPHDKLKKAGGDLQIIVKEDAA